MRRIARLGRLGSAGLVLMFSAALALAQTTSDHDLAKGIRQVEGGYLEDAVATLEAVARRLSGQPTRSRDLAQTYLYLGIAFAQLDTEKAARASFREALKWDPDLKLDADFWSPKVLRPFAAAQVEAVELEQARIRKRDAAKKQQEAYDNARRADTAAGYEGFIAAYASIPEAEQQVSEVRARLAELNAPPPVPPAHLVIPGVSVGPWVLWRTKPEDVLAVVGKSCEKTKHRGLMMSINCGPPYDKSSDPEATKGLEFHFSAEDLENDGVLESIKIEEVERWPFRIPGFSGWSIADVTREFGAVQDAPGPYTVYPKKGIKFTVFDERVYSATIFPVPQPAPPQPDATDMMLIPGRGFGSLILGVTTLEEARAALSGCRLSSGGLFDHSLECESLDAEAARSRPDTILFRSGVAVEMRFAYRQTEVSLPNGIKIGSSKEDALASLGPSRSRDKDELRYPALGLELWISDGRVMRITVFPPKVPPLGGTGRVDSPSPSMR